MKKLFFILILIFAFGTLLLKAQEVISSGGAHVKGSGISLSWTIGEPVIETLTNGSYTLTQGFHQSRLSSTAVDNLPTPGLILTVFPNPFSYVLNVKVDEGDYSQLQYTMYSFEGKVLLNSKISKSLTQIELQPFASGSYLLRISKKSGEPVKTFKVVKN